MAVRCWATEMFYSPASAAMQYLKKFDTTQKIRLMSPRPLPARKAATWIINRQNFFILLLGWFRIVSWDQRTLRHWEMTIIRPTAEARAFIITFPATFQAHNGYDATSLLIFRLSRYRRIQQIYRLIATPVPIFRFLAMRSQQPHRSLTVWGCFSLAWAQQ